MQLLKKQKKNSQFFAAILKLTSNFEHFEKKNMTLIGYVFPKLRSVKRAEINVLKVSSQNIVQKSTS